MTPEELLKDLRDIHLPAPPREVAAFDIAVEPFIVVGVILLAAVVVAYRRRCLWRAEARAHLREVERAPASAETWSRLVALAAATSRRSRAGPPPDCVYLPVERIGPDEVAEVQRFVRAALRR